MVRIVEPWHKKRIQKAIDQEKKNIFYCMNPAATVVRNFIVFFKKIFAQIWFSGARKSFVPIDGPRGRPKGRSLQFEKSVSRK